LRAAHCRPPDPAPSDHPFISSCSPHSMAGELSMLQLYRHILRAARDFPSVRGSFAVWGLCGAGPVAGQCRTPQQQNLLSDSMSLAPSTPQVKKASIIREIKAEFRANMVRGVRRASHKSHRHTLLTNAPATRPPDSHLTTAHHPHPNTPPPPPPVSHGARQGQPLPRAGGARPVRPAGLPVCRRAPL
jgi:hypothetical protein